MDGASSPSRWGGSSRAPFWVIAATVTASAIVLGAVILGSSNSGGGASGVGGETYTSARDVANAALALHGSWNLWFAEGVGPTNSTTLPLNLSADPNCTVTSLSGTLPTQLTFPAYRGNLLSGGASAWIFEYLAANLSGEVVLVVTNGAVVLAVEESGEECVPASLEVAPIPSTAVDSSVAVAAAAAAGGSAFLAAHPTGTSIGMTIVGSLTEGGLSYSPTWNVVFTTCTLLGSSPSSSGYEFTASVNATTGVVLPDGVSNGTCGIAPTGEGIGSAVQFGGPVTEVGAGTGGTVASQGCTSGDTCVELPITATYGNLTPGDFSSELVSNSTQTVYPSVGFAILTASGQVLVYSYGSTEQSWSSGVGSSYSSVSAGMTLVIDVGTGSFTAYDWTLQLTGLGPYVGSTLGVVL